MSTKSTLLYINPAPGAMTHKLHIHAYKEMYESDGVIKFDIGCATCSCDYSFIMDKHVGEQLIDLLKIHEIN